MSSAVRGAAIVGAGVVSADHIRAFESLGHRVRLVGIADLDQAKLFSATRDHFVPVSTDDYTELLERDDVDVVSVCTPPGHHERIVIDALEAGKYVICEKPLAATLAAADRIMEIAKAHPGRLSVVYQNRYDPGFQKVQHLVNEGLLGEPLFGQCTRFSGLAGTSGAAGGWWGDWKNAGGGVVTTQFIHHLDQLWCLFGDAVQVQATIGTLSHPIQSEDTFSAAIRFASGAIANCAATVADHGFDYELRVVGSDASAGVPWRLDGPAGIKERAQRELTGRFVEPSRLDRENLPSKVARRLARQAGRYTPPPRLHTVYIERVLDAIDAGDELPSPPEQARKSLELCAAIYEAGISQEIVDLPIGSTNRFYEGVTVEAYESVVR